MSEYIEFFISHGLAFGFLSGFSAYFLGLGVSYGLNLFSVDIRE